MATFRHTLAQLGLALINATLLLALALALVVWQVTARLDDLADVTVNRLAQRLVLPDLGPRLDRIEARLAATAGADLVAEARALRSDLAAFRAGLDTAELATAVAGAIVDETARRLSESGAR